MLKCIASITGHGCLVVWNWQGASFNNNAIIFQGILHTISSPSLIANLGVDGGTFIAFFLFVSLVSLLHLFCWKAPLYEPTAGGPRVDRVTGLGPMGSCGCDRQKRPGCGIQCLTGLFGAGMFTVCSWDGPQVTGAVLLQTIIYLLHLLGPYQFCPWLVGLSWFHQFCCWNPKLYEPTPEPPKVVVGAPVAAVGAPVVPPVAVAGMPQPPMPPVAPPAVVAPAQGAPVGAPALPVPPNYGATGA